MGECMSAVNAAQNEKTKQLEEERVNKQRESAIAEKKKFLENRQCSTQSEHEGHILYGKIDDHEMRSWSYVPYNLIDICNSEKREKVQQIYEECKNGIAKSAPNPYCPPMTNIELTAQTADDEIMMASITSAFCEQQRVEVTQYAYNGFHTKIERCLREVQGMPENIKKSERQWTREKMIRVAVDKAFDDAVLAIKREKNLQ
eukprot:47182_1